jgi:Ca2+-binding EF-hand superfamily protein
MKTIAVLGTMLLLATPALAQDTGAVFAALDTNHDGKISKAEAQKNQMVSQMFAQADKDHDGFLSKAEFDAAFGKK